MTDRANHSPTAYVHHDAVVYQAYVGELMTLVTVPVRVDRLDYVHAELGDVSADLDSVSADEARAAE